MSYLLKALIAKLEGEKEVAKANIRTYIRNSAGIGEHPGIVEAMETEVEKIAQADEKIATIVEYFSDQVFVIDTKKYFLTDGFKFDIIQLYLNKNIHERQILYTTT